MKKTFSPGRLLILLTSACLLSTYLLFLKQVPLFSIQKHSFDLPAVPFLLLSLLLFLLLYNGWALFSKWGADRFSLDITDTGDRTLWTLAPVLFLLLIPVLNIFYLDSSDLSHRLQLLGLALFFAFVYLNVANLHLWNRDSPHPILPIFRKFFSLSTRHKLILLFVASLLVYNAGSALLLYEGISLSGDEPHYLVISQSLRQDGDFDLSNNYAARDYRKYMPPTTRLEPHIAPRTQNSYSFHSPGLSILLLPFYALGSLFGGNLQLFCVRFGMSLFGALLGLQVFLYACQEWRKEKLALGLWAVFSFSSPIFFYSLHIYPEIVVTLFSLYIFRRLRFSSSFSRLSLLFMGLLMSSFIWLHAVKYIFILIPLLLYCLWKLLRTYKVGWNIMLVLVFPVGLTLLHLAFSHSYYGSYSIFSVSLKGATTSQESAAFLHTLVSEFSFRSRWETLAGYFFDQRDGLLFYAPVYFFAFLGMLEMIRHKGRDLLVLLFLSMPYVLFHAFVTQRTSFAPQARTLVAVFWVAAIFLGAFLAYGAKPFARRLYKGAIFISLMLVYLLLRNPWALYQPTTAGESERAGSLFISLSHLYFYLPNFLPSYLKIYDSYWYPNLVWMGILVLFCAGYVFWKSRSADPGFSRHVVTAFMGLSLFFVWIVLFPRLTLLYPVNTTFSSQQKLTFFALGKVVRMTGPGRFRITADKRAYVFHFTSWRTINALDLNFGSDQGDYYVEVHLFDQELFKGETSHDIKNLNLPDPDFYAYKKAHLYRVSIYLERRSAVSIVEHPFFFSITPR